MNLQLASTKRLIIIINLRVYVIHLVNLSVHTSLTLPLLPCCVVSSDDVLEEEGEFEVVNPEEQLGEGTSNRKRKATLEVDRGRKKFRQNTPLEV